jgi:hypothetical protein
LNRRHLFAAAFLLHFLLIFTVSSRQMFSALADQNTIFPRSWNDPIAGAASALSVALGDYFSFGNLYRQGVACYTNSAGVETGYGFFAPSVASTHKLVFEIRYPDGRVEYELPSVGNSATGLRLTLLFDNIARTRYRPLRETMLKLMAYSVWNEHRDARLIRAVFGAITPPSVQDFERGGTESYEVLFAYDFTFAPETAPLRP